MTGVGLLQRLRDLDDRVLPPPSRNGLETLAAAMTASGIVLAVAGRGPGALFAFALAIPAGVVAGLDRRRQRRQSA